MAQSVLTQLKRLDQQRAKLVQGAKKEAMAKAKVAIAELNELGFNYELVDRGAQRSGPTRTSAKRTSAKHGGVRRSKAKRIGAKRKGSRAGTRGISDAPCPICGFKTAPPHDGRRHKLQGDKKRRFTDQELADMGYRKAA